MRELNTELRRQFGLDGQRRRSVMTTRTKRAILLVLALVIIAIWGIHLIAWIVAALFVSLAILD